MTTNSTTPLWTGPRLAILAVLLGVQFAAAWYVGTTGLLENNGASVIPPSAVMVVVPERSRPAVSRSRKAYSSKLSVPPLTVKA